MLVVVVVVVVVVVAAVVVVALAVVLTNIYCSNYTYRSADSSQSLSY
jgi:uncharacterized protein YpuA (DUF1002 family)